MYLPLGKQVSKWSIAGLITHVFVYKYVTYVCWFSVMYFCNLEVY